MNPEMFTHLRDIHGLDEIPWWPLAAGWWLLALLVLVLLVALASLLRHLRRYPPGSWRRDAWRQLRRLRQQAADMPAPQLAGELSELLRRIAIARLGRERVAGLSGERWLAWLQQHDPRGFAWADRGRALITLPYAPPGQERDSAPQLLALVDAAFAWVDRGPGGERV